MSVATVFLWCGTLLVTLTFLSLVNLFTVSGVFLLYATVSIAAFLFVWRRIPETNGRTLEDIEKWWQPEYVEQMIDGWRKGGLEMAAANAPMTRP